MAAPAVDHVVAIRGLNGVCRSGGFCHLLLHHLGVGECGLCFLHGGLLVFFSPYLFYVYEDRQAFLKPEAVGGSWEYLEGLVDQGHFYGF